MVTKKKTIAKKASSNTNTTRKSRVRSKAKEYFNKSCTTPKGILSYPVLHEPRITNDGKEQWSVDIYVSKEDMESEAGQKFMKVIEEALEFYGIEQDDCEHFPIVDMDETDNPAEHEVGMYRIRAKNKLAAPTIIDRKKQNLTEEEVAAIKGGDIGKINVSPFEYTWQDAPGFGLGLEIVMFIEEGEPLGGGAVARASAVAEMEVEDLEDTDIEDEEEDDTEFDS